MLILDPPSREKAARFHAGQTSAEDVRGDPLLRRWQRVASWGLRADGKAHAQGTTSHDLVTRRARLDAIFRDAQRDMASRVESLAARGVFALVADTDGVIVSTQDGGGFLEHAAQVRLVEASRWDEPTRGTNAIGTALIEDRPVGVIGSAHFEERNHGLFCYAAPVHDPYGSVVAVLNVTGPMAAHDAAVGAAVREASVAVENVLRAMAYAAAAPATLALVDVLLHRSATPVMLVEADGRVANANPGAVALAHGVPLSCRGVFQLDFDALVLNARRDGALRCRLPGGEFRVQLDPVEGTGGRVLAVLATFERNVPPARRAMVEPLEQGAPWVSARPAAVPAPVDASPWNQHLPAFDAVVSADAAVDAAKAKAARFAVTPLPVLLLAETGTGKELFARAIHGASPRHGGPFVALNCGALSPSLLESELFGHAPGAFTGATRTGSDGMVGAAHGGTLFLDEIAEMPDALQAALLRVLDEGTYHRVGDARPRKSDFRLVSATCRDLPLLVEQGRFRRDLFFRIHGACVTIPPLRARLDRLVLAEGLLEALSPGRGHALADDAREWILAHPWPGNVRELKSALAHAVALCPDGVLRRSHFPSVLLGSPAPSSRVSAPLGQQAIEDALAAAHGNVSEAARRLGVARSTVYRARGRTR